MALPVLTAVHCGLTAVRQHAWTARLSCLDSKLSWCGCRQAAILNLLISPFLLVFLLMYLFLSNAERLYHHPSSVGARRWSSLASWRLREFNELSHYLQHR